MTDESFWGARPELAAIRQHARSRRVSPLAVLGCVLARVIASMEPAVQLPPIVGGYGSLNLFVGIVGRSGAGKGASQAAAAALFDPIGGALFETLNVGSGEGIAAAYVQRAKDADGNVAIEQHSESALLDVAEVDTVAALAGRQGSTLLSELRKVWSGERLGFQNRDQSRTLPVEAHTYRAALIAGIQPTRAGALLNDTDGGTPQRFVWLPATDHEAPETAPNPPAQIQWRVPGEHVLPTVNGRRVISVCDLAWDTIDHAQLARLRGEGDALDGHALFSRLKVAAALALLDRRGDVTPDDWTLAGQIMVVSDRTRKACIDAIAQAARESNSARAEARAEANVTAADHAEIVAVARTKDRILAKLTTDWIGAGPVRSGLSRSLREHFDAAVAELVADGAVQVSRDTYQSQDRVRMRISPSGLATPPTLTATPELPRSEAISRVGKSGLAVLPTLTETANPDASLTTEESA